MAGKSARGRVAVGVHNEQVRGDTHTHTHAHARTHAVWLGIPYVVGSLARFRYS